MKVSVRYDASETQRQDTFDIENDFGITVEQWNDYSEDAKREMLMDAVEQNHIYWMVDTFTESKD